MNYTREEILNAIRTIANVCLNQTDECNNSNCDSCPFGNKDGDCFFWVDDNLPKYWLDYSEDKIWRAVEF